MRKFLLGFILLTSLLQSCTSQETTYYLIRHSEKDRSSQSERNPNLTDKGKERAANWASYFEDINLDAVYSTNYNRTIQTATPTAEGKKLEIITYDPTKIYTDDFQKETKGKNVLIVGHSNTTPFFVNKIIGENKYSEMDDNDNSSLFIVKISGGKTTSEVIKID